MRIEKKDHTTVFSWEKGDPRGVDFKNLIKGHYKYVLSQNIIVDLSLRYPLYANQLLEFSELSSYHKSEANKSFVLVTEIYQLTIFLMKFLLHPPLMKPLILLRWKKLNVI